jgi:hypothetical protein
MEEFENSQGLQESPGILAYPKGYEPIGSSKPIRDSN